METEESSPKEIIFNFFKDLAWPAMTFEDSKISCPSGTILTFEGKSLRVKFHYYNKAENQYREREGKQELIIEYGVDSLSILSKRYRGNGYDIQWFDYIKNIFSIDDSFLVIKITKKGKKVLKKINDKMIQIPAPVFLELASDSRDVYKSGQSSKGRIETYLINKLKLKYTNKAPKEVTTVGKGDFSFIIERFNLKNKNSKKDYEKYFSEEDIGNIEYFTEKLIKDEVLSSDFLHALDEYFIKQKLKDIIKLGREILDLGTSDVSSQKAKNVIAKIIGDGEEVRQMETVWQRFFEKNLLYLVFSYKKIYPKIEFKDIIGDKKYPDFIGINHYNGLDIIEIKTHLKNAVTWDSSHKNFSFSSELSKSIIQTMNYMDALVQQRFQNPNDGTKITNLTEEENLYHPRGIIIISSDRKLTKSRLTRPKEIALRRDFTKLRNSLQNIEILTFSEILQIADDYVKNIHSQYTA